MFVWFCSLHRSPIMVISNNMSKHCQGAISDGHTCTFDKTLYQFCISWQTVLACIHGQQDTVILQPFIQIYWSLYNLYIPVDIFSAIVHIAMCVANVLSLRACSRDSHKYCNLRIHYHTVFVWYKKCTVFPYVLQYNFKIYTPFAQP